MRKGKPRNTIEKFWSWVPPDDPDERVCTIWQGPKWSSGYGKFSNKLRMSIYAHRAINELRHGKIPDGIQICHTCDVPPCMRDSHHWRGTFEDNIRDMLEKGRGAIDKGEKHWAAILTEFDVLAIRDLASKGISCSIIASSFLVSYAVVREIVSRRNWKWL